MLVYVCVCHRDRKSVCYQEKAKFNRGNSTGLLQADFKRGDADSQHVPTFRHPHTHRVLMCSHTTLICEVSHIHNLLQCQSAFVLSSENKQLQVPVLGPFIPGQQYSLISGSYWTFTQSLLSVLCAQTSKRWIDQSLL